MLAGTAAATLVGLLFVGLSLHLRVVIASSEVRSLARVTLANFGAMLFVALFMVIPQDQSTAAVELIASGLASLVITTPSLVGALQSQDRTLQMRPRDRARLLLRFGLSVASYLAITVAGPLLLSSNQAFTRLVVASRALLLLSLRNTWGLLVTGRDAAASPPPATPDGAGACRGNPRGWTGRRPPWQPFARRAQPKLADADVHGLPRPARGWKGHGLACPAVEQSAAERGCRRDQTPCH